MTKWFLYILKCNDETYYTGATINIKARLEKHNAGKGAKYTRSRRPCYLKYAEEYKSEKKAKKREREIKSWTRSQKERLIDSLLSSSLKDFLRTPDSD